MKSLARRASFGRRWLALPRTLTRKSAPPSSAVIFRAAET